MLNLNLLIPLQSLFSLLIIDQLYHAWSYELEKNKREKKRKAETEFDHNLSQLIINFTINLIKLTELIHWTHGAVHWSYSMANQSFDQIN